MATSSYTRRVVEEVEVSPDSVTLTMNEDEARLVRSLLVQGISWYPGPGVSAATKKAGTVAHETWLALVTSIEALWPDSDSLDLRWNGTYFDVERPW